MGVQDVVEQFSKQNVSWLKIKHSTNPVQLAKLAKDSWIHLTFALPNYKTNMWKYFAKDVTVDFLEWLVSEEHSTQLG